MIRFLHLLFFAMLHCCYAAAKTCWTSEQDMQLMNSIQKHGTSSWSTIAAEVTGKINKQCRERYMCHLDPIIDKTPLSDEEISKLGLAVQELGPKWSEISKERFTLPTGIRRTDLQLKNVWYSHHRSALSTTTRKRSVSEHLDEPPTATLQQVSSALPSISAKRTKKKKKAAQAAITSSVFHSQPPYSAAPLGDSHLLSNAQLPLNGQPLILPSLLMLSSNVTHSGLVVPNNAPLQLPRNC